MDKTITGQRDSNCDIDIAAFQLYFPSLAITVHKQLEDYSTHQFVSELGGAAGIVLGVSLFTIIKGDLI